MIPRKITKFTFPPEGYKDMTKEEKAAVHARLDKRKPCTEAQKLAQKENFAIFTLSGMLSNLKHLRELDASDANRLEYYVKQSIVRIKSRQSSRQVKKEKK